jgi:hypothetical protein
LIISKDSPILVSCLAHSILLNDFEWLAGQIDYYAALITVAHQTIIMIAQTKMLLAQKQVVVAQIQLIVAQTDLDVFALTDQHYSQTQVAVVVDASHLMNIQVDVNFKFLIKLLEIVAIDSC